ATRTPSAKPSTPWRQAARSGTNIMPPSIEAAKATVEMEAQAGSASGAPRDENAVGQALDALEAGGALRHQHHAALDRGRQG
ncbi:hypothetical protein CTI14_67715, partial [Methylobacterium radiotolerans]